MPSPFPKRTLALLFALAIPYYHVGVRANYPVNDRLSLAGSVVNGWNDAVESNAVEVHIHALRKKLGADLIRNVRGVGWLAAKPRVTT